MTTRDRLRVDEAHPAGVSALQAGAACGRLIAKVLERRRSVRRFDDRALKADELEQLLRAGISAPSGSNWQNQRFLVVTDRAEIERIGQARFVWPYRNSDPARIRESNPAGLLGHAAALILVFADSHQNDRRGEGEYYLWESLEIQNCAASIQNILIQATAMGLATCWVSASDPMSRTRLLSGRSWRDVLSDYAIPEWYKMQGIIAVGAPKKVDEEGFAIGESKHGATIWQEVDRQPTSYYTIGRRSETSVPIAKLSGWNRFRLRLFSKLLKFFQARVADLDRRIHRIEIRRGLGHVSDPVREKCPTSEVQV